MIRMWVWHMRWPFRAWGCHFGCGLQIFLPDCLALRLRHGALLSIRLRSGFPAAGSPVRRDPFFCARNAPACPRPPPRAFRAGAKRAPDCPREAGAGRTSPLRFFGVFSRRRERERTGSAAAASSSPHNSTLSQVVNKQYELFLINANKTPSRPAVVEPAVRAAIGFSPDSGYVSAGGRAHPMSPKLSLPGAPMDSQEAEDRQ